MKRVIRAGEVLGRFETWPVKRTIWNPHAPDNMMVRHRALQRGKAAPETFVAEQRMIRSLARRTRSMEARGELPDPTVDEARAFFAECRAAGFEGVPKDPP